MKQLNSKINAEISTTQLIKKIKADFKTNPMINKTKERLMLKKLAELEKIHILNNQLKKAIAAEKKSIAAEKKQAGRI